MRTAPRWSCLTPGCPGDATQGPRRLCPSCATVAGMFVRAGVVSWRELEAEGLAQPLPGRQMPRMGVPPAQPMTLAIRRLAARPRPLVAEAVTDSPTDGPDLRVHRPEGGRVA